MLVEEIVVSGGSGGDGSRAGGMAPDRSSSESIGSVLSSATRDSAAVVKKQEAPSRKTVSYTHLRAHETGAYL
eukprot:5836138-Pyramimonas_sp.AAC.1